MRFSILIPVYNVEQYLRECLDSVMNQTYSDYEVVVVDDGSTDNSGLICEEYCQVYPEKVRVIHKDNQGLISARRVGIGNAKGEFCVFVDSDDNIEPDLLKTISDYLSKDETIDIVLYSYRYLRDGIKAERYPAAFADDTVWTKDNKKELFEALVVTNRITTIWTKAIRTAVLRDDPIDYHAYYHLNMAEDLLQSLYPIAKARKICYADRVLYNYRINSESISHSYKLEKVKKNNTLHVYDEIMKCLPQWEMDTITMQDRVNARWFHDVMYQFSKCYENASSQAEKNEIFAFDWGSMFPSMKLKENHYINKKYRQMYTRLAEKRYILIRIFFWKKDILKKIRQAKRSLLG